MRPKHKGATGMRQTRPLSTVTLPWIVPKQEYEQSRHCRMSVFSKLARFSLALALATVLAMAGVARASHEAHAPAQVFLSADDQALSGKTCLSFHVDEAGLPIKRVHIHACGDCLFAIDQQMIVDPPTTVLLRLQAPKRLAFDPQPPVHIAGVEQFSSHSPRAPPLFS